MINAEGEVVGVVRRIVGIVGAPQDPPPAQTGGPHDAAQTGGPHDAAQTGGPHDAAQTGGPHDAAQTGGPHDAAHLDEDAECLEDPVHCGDARHQHAVRAVAPSSQVARSKSTEA